MVKIKFLMPSDMFKNIKMILGIRLLKNPLYKKLYSTTL